MSKLEGRIQYEILEAIGCEPDLDIFRNTVGVTRQLDADTGKTRIISYGLGKGSPDLVGMLAPNGRWFCLEVKTEAGAKKNGEHEKQQEVWAEMIRFRGGFCAKVTSAEEAKAALERARRGERK